MTHGNHFLEVERKDACNHRYLLGGMSMDCGLVVDGLESLFV